MRDVNIINKYKKIPILTINDRKFYLYFPPIDLRTQYKNESLEWLFNKYKETQNQEFIIWFYMYKIATIIFGKEAIISDLKKGRRFRQGSFNEFFNEEYCKEENGSYKKSPPSPKISFKHFSLDTSQRDVPSVEKTFETLIKGFLENSNLYFDSEPYVDFRNNFLNDLIKFTWENKNLSWADIRKWSEAKFEEINKPDYKILLRWDSERYWLQIEDRAFRKIYKVIRRYLSKEERRLFILCWFMYYKTFGIKFSQYPFGYRIPFFYRIFLDFYMGISDEIRKKILDRVLLKKYDEELGKEWNKYLSIYPIWLLMVRDSDKIEKQNERRLLKETSLQEVVANDEESGELTLKGIIGKEDYSILQRLMDKEHIEGMLKEMTNKERELVELRMEGCSVSEIAQKKRVSQPAISKMLKNIRKKLKTNLT